MAELSLPNELAGATAFRDALRRFNERLSDPDDSLQARSDDQIALSELERDMEAKRTRHLLAAWKLREARQAFEAAQKEVSLLMGQYRMLQNDAASRMEQIARECGEPVADETVELPEHALPGINGNAAPAANTVATAHSASARTTWLRQTL